MTTKKTIGNMETLEKFLEFSLDGIRVKKQAESETEENKKKYKNQDKMLTEWD
jgi:hypothetical protein